MSISCFEQVSGCLNVAGTKVSGLFVMILRSKLTRSRVGLWVLLAAMLLVPSLARARSTNGGGGVYVPPGLSSASQYTEVVPTADGTTPTQDLQRDAGGVTAALPAEVMRTLGESPAGRAAARFAEASGGSGPHGPARTVRRPAASGRGSFRTDQVVEAAATNGTGGWASLCPSCSSA